MSEPVTKSGNFYFGVSLSGKCRLIKETIENSPYPISPREICLKTGINGNTVKKYVRDLERRGFVRRKFHGHYVSVKNLVTFGSSILGGVLPRLHCLRLRCDGVVGGGWVWDFGVVRVRCVVYGNGSATVFVDCDKNVSLDYVAFRLLVSFVVRELGVSDWGKVTVSSFEFNHDFEGVRLDGCQAVTLKSFDGSFRRLYNKRFGLRDEVKAVGSKRVEDVLALLGGGVSQYNLLQLLFLQTRKLDEYVEATKFQSRLFGEAVSSMSRLADAVLKKDVPGVPRFEPNLRTSVEWPS